MRLQPASDVVWVYFRSHYSPYVSPDVFDLWDWLSLFCCYSLFPCHQYTSSALMCVVQPADVKALCKCWIMHVFRLYESQRAAHHTEWRQTTTLWFLQASELLTWTTKELWFPNTNTRTHTQRCFRPLYVRVSPPIVPVCLCPPHPHNATAAARFLPPAKELDVKTGRLIHGRRDETPPLK